MKPSLYCIMEIGDDPKDIQYDTFSFSGSLQELKEKEEKEARESEEVHFISADFTFGEEAIVITYFVPSTGVEGKIVKRYIMPLKETPSI